MLWINQFTSDPQQNQKIVLADGTFFTMYVAYYQLQQGWFITQLTYNSFTLNSMRITNSPNMLQQFRNQLPFGIGCFSNAQREPSLIQDFSSQSSKLYLLDSTDLAFYENFLNGQV